MGGCEFDSIQHWKECALAKLSYFEIKVARLDTPKKIFIKDKSKQNSKFKTV